MNRKQLMQIQNAAAQLMVVIMDRESIGKEKAEGMVVNILKEYEDVLKSGDFASVIQGLHHLSKNW
jgi:hypothetical protein